MYMYMSYFLYDYNLCLISALCNYWVLLQIHFLLRPYFMYYSVFDCLSALELHRIVRFINVYIFILILQKRGIPTSITHSVATATSVYLKVLNFLFQHHWKYTVCLCVQYTYLQHAKYVDSNDILSSLCFILPKIWNSGTNLQMILCALSTVHKNCTDTYPNTSPGHQMADRHKFQSWASDGRQT